MSIWRDIIWFRVLVFFHKFERGVFFSEFFIGRIRQGRDCSEPFNAISPLLGAFKECSHRAPSLGFSAGVRSLGFR